jgi:hypothetical protein
MPMRGGGLLQRCHCPHWPVTPSFRLHFRAAVGVSPNTYRRTFLTT